MSIVHLSDSSTQAGAIQHGPGIGLAAAIDAQAVPHVVTAVAAADGSLKLIAWKAAANGRSIGRIGDSGAHAGQVLLVSMAASGQNRFITAVRTAQGALKLIAWQLNFSTGQVMRLSDSGDASGVVTRLAMTQSPLGDGRVVVALRNTAGNLVLQNWELTPGLALKKVGDTGIQQQPAGAISLVSLGTIGQHVFTAVRDSGGNLKVIVWAVLPSGALQRLGDSGGQAGAIDLVDAVSLKDLIVTAVRDSGHDLKLIAWHVSPDGMTVTRRADSGDAAGGIDRLACVRLVEELVFDGTLGRVFTAVRTKTGTLKIIAWLIGANGSVSRAEDFGDRPGLVDMIAISGTGDIFVSAVRDAFDQRLHLDVWRLDSLAPPRGLDHNLVVYDGSYWENTAQALPPGIIQKGRIVVHLGQPRESCGFVTRDLLDAGGSNFALTAPQTKTPHPFDAATQKPATDNQLIRLKDGSLLGIKNGYVWTGLQTPPPWFDTVDLSGQSSQRARNAVFVFRSTDGITWTLVSFIDSAVAAGGDYGWPQPGANPGTYGVGGFDRTELYQDPWSGDVYVSGGGDGGPYTENGLNVSHHAGVVFVSKDNGASWSTLHVFSGQGKGGAPYVMTSTANHPLVVFNVWKGTPTLSWLNKGASSLSGGVAVPVQEAGAAVSAASDAGIDDLRGAPPAIARIGSAGAGRDRVWIAYKALNASGRQVYKIAAVTFGGASDPLVEPVATIEGRDPERRAACLGAFVQDDRIDTSVGNPANLTLFHWIDAPPKDAAEADGLFARFKVLFGTTGHYQSGDLSVNGGVPRGFNRVGIGDYFKGGYFEWNGKLHFLLQWREPTKLMGTVVSMTP